MKNDKNDNPLPLVKDPVCGMLITQLTAVADYYHRGKTYYFCAENCRDRFAADPDRYLHKGGKWRR
jgi:Cu+-exporting ATPase